MESSVNYEDYIVQEKAICGGEPVVKETGVTVRAVLARISWVLAPSARLAHFPTPTARAVRAIIASATASAEENLPLPGIPHKAVLGIAVLCSLSPLASKASAIAQPPSNQKHQAEELDLYPIGSSEEFVDAEARGGDTDELIAHAPQRVRPGSTREQIRNLRHAVARERLGGRVVAVPEREIISIE